MTHFFTRGRYNYSIHEISEFKFLIDRDTNIGMNVPVKIYANESLISNMISDRTIQQAINVSTLPGVTKHVVVLPDGHEGYGFPVGGVAATDLIEGGVISPGG
jgi:tRNA-splicing ligase RtcB